jgi:superfamily II helicase
MTPRTGFKSQYLFCTFLYSQYPSQATTDILQRKGMKVFPMHAGNTIRDNNNLEAAVRSGKSSVAKTSICIDIHQHRRNQPSESEEGYWGLFP